MTLFKRFPALMLSILLALSLWAASAESNPPADYDINAPQNLNASQLYAQSALLVDEDSGEILFTKDSRVRMYPASTTKIMTLLLALESGIAPDAQVTIPVEAGDVPQGSSVIPVKPGDVTSFSDLLYGFMLSSGNDGANAIAVLVSGSIDAFVARMNARAAEIGLAGTHYVNAHGYHDPEHYTTAQDLALLSREAMKNDDFRRIVAAPRWTMTIRRGDETVHTEIISRNSLLQSDQKYYYPDCTGIKTGHHNKAGWCFVGSAERDGMRLICVVLNCEQENDKWYDAARLFEYGFTCYEDAKVAELLERARGDFARVQIEGADPADPEGGSLLMDLEPLENGGATVKIVSGSEAARAAAQTRVAEAVDVEWTRDLQAPVEAGETMGEARCALPDGSVVAVALKASRSIAAKPEATPPAATAVPAPTATPTTPEAPSPAKKGGGGFLVIALLILLLALCVAALLAVTHAKKRREAARRRAKRRKAPAARGTRPASSASDKARTAGTRGRSR